MAADPAMSKAAANAAVEVGTSQLQNQALAYAFRVFGRPPRTSACDCERAMEPALPQRLFLMTDPTLLAKFNDPQGRLQALAVSKLTNDEVLDELFLATLTRLPNDRERKAFAANFRAKYKISPDLFAEYGYVGGKALGEALKRKRQREIQIIVGDVAIVNQDCSRRLIRGKPSEC